MRKIIYRFSVSLDGYIEAADGDISWSAPDAQLHQHFNDLERTVDAFLYGRRLYENMTAFWPKADQDASASEQVKEYARLWRDKPKFVFSNTLKKVAWNSTLVRGDIAAAVNKLKDQPGNEMTVGGAGLAASLMNLGLIDEYWLYLHPVLLGRGKPMFGPLKDKIGMRLLVNRSFDSGVVLMQYGVLTNQKTA
jgi:dihydrofolate reductase